MGKDINKNIASEAACEHVHKLDEHELDQTAGGFDLPHFPVAWCTHCGWQGDRYKLENGKCPRCHQNAV